MEFPLKPPKILFIKPMRSYLHILLICLLALAVGIAPAQDSNSGASGSRQPDQKSSAASSRNPEAAQQAEADGEQLLFRKKDLKGAIEGFKKSIRLDPSYERGYMMLGVAYMQAGDWSDAQWAFEEVSRLNPDDLRACVGIGSALNEQKDYPGAQKTLLHCLELKPNSAEVEYELARSLWGLNKWDAAELHVQKAIGFNKDYAEPHFLMGNLLLRREDAEGALAEFREYLRLEPDGAEASEVRDVVAKLEAALKQK